MVVHTYNPSYLGVRDEFVASSGKVREPLYQNIKTNKRLMAHGSSGIVLAT
jgi:hypothetical protein